MHIARFIVGLILCLSAAAVMLLYRDNQGLAGAITLLVVGLVLVATGRRRSANGKGNPPKDADAP